MLYNKNFLKICLTVHVLNNTFKNCFFLSVLFDYKSFSHGPIVKEHKICVLLQNRS